MEEKQPNMSSFINTKPGLENSNLPSVSSSSHATNTISSNLPGFHPNPPLRPQSTQWRTWGQNQEAWVSTIISDQDQERKSTHKRSNSVLHRPIDKEHKMKQRQVKIACNISVIIQIHSCINYSKESWASSHKNYVLWCNLELLEIQRFKIVWFVCWWIKGSSALFLFSICAFFWSSCKH